MGGMWMHLVCSVSSGPFLTKNFEFDQVQSPSLTIIMFEIQSKDITKHATDFPLCLHIQILIICTETRVFISIIFKAVMF